MPEPSLIERVEAVALELHVLRDEAAIAGDEALLPTLKEADRIFHHFGTRSQAGDFYAAVKSRLERELHLEHARQLRDIAQKHHNQTNELLAELTERRRELEASERKLKAAQEALPTEIPSAPPPPRKSSRLSKRR